jgi:hypothetical protein
VPVQAARLDRCADAGREDQAVLDEWHLERWRGNILAKLGDSSALDSLMVALDRTPSTYVRATAALHFDIAQSLGARGDRAGSLRHAQQARTLARQTGSIRQLRRKSMAACSIASRSRSPQRRLRSGAGVGPHCASCRLPKSCG